MHRLTLLSFAALLSVALGAAGQYYVPKAYFTIDAEGHESAPVPLRRLRRSFYPNWGGSYPGGGHANANANANALGDGSATANANANAGRGWGQQGGGGWGQGGHVGAELPSWNQPGTWQLGSANPNARRRT